MSWERKNCLRCRSQTANAGLICGLCLDLGECNQVIRDQISAIRKSRANTIERRRQDVARMSFEEWEKSKQTAICRDGLGE